MRSLELSLNEYDSDKINNDHLKKYDQVFKPYIDKKIALLELGVLKGGSLKLWRDYFPFGTIVGIDIKLPESFDPGERIHIFEGNQADLQFLSQVANKMAPEGFDIIIDDASHVGEPTKTAFWHLFDNHLKPNGLYVIEDWGTGYWGDWPDGKRLNLESYAQQKFTPTRFWLFFLKKMGKLGLKLPMHGHCYGMVGFIKQLIDEQAAEDATKGTQKGKPARRSKFEKMVIMSSIVFIKKAFNYDEVGSSDLVVDDVQLGPL